MSGQIKRTSIDFAHRSVGRLVNRVGSVSKNENEKTGVDPRPLYKHRHRIPLVSTPGSLNYRSAEVNAGGLIVRIRCLLGSGLIAMSPILSVVRLVYPISRRFRDSNPSHVHLAISSSARCPSMTRLPYVSLHNLNVHCERATTCVLHISGVLIPISIHIRRPFTTAFRRTVVSLGTTSTPRVAKSKT